MAEPAASMSTAREAFFAQPSQGAIKEQFKEKPSGKPDVDSEEIKGLSSFRRIWQQRWNEAPESWRRFVANNKKVFGLTDDEEKKIRTRNETYIETPHLTERARFGTTLIIGAVGAFSKILMTAFNKLHLYNMDALYEAIENQNQTGGLLTFSNHQSVTDDPFLLAAMLPARILLNPDLMRWGMCSLDICFQDALISRTLRLGKAIPIERRGGIAQNFLRDAAEKLTHGNWVHVYPEGRVRQDGIGYSKRGVGKLLAMAYEARQGLPAILPIYHEGAEQVMPQDSETHRLESMIPKTRKTLFAMTGEPVDVGHIFDRLMPACAEAGGTRLDPPPCLRLYEEVADFMTITMRLMRAELRKRVHAEQGINLGEPYEFS